MTNRSRRLTQHTVPKSERLRACAPEVIQALRRLLNQAEAEHRFDGTWREAMQRARDVIAKVDHGEDSE